MKFFWSKVFVGFQVGAMISKHYNFLLAIIESLPFWEPKFSAPDARRQTFVSFFSGFQVHAGRKRDFLYRTTL